MGRRPKSAANNPESSNDPTAPTSPDLTQTNSLNPSNLAENVKRPSATIRRSERLKDSVVTMEIAPLVHEIRSESEKEDEQRVQVEETVQEPFLADKSLEEKINDLLYLLESQKKTSESAKDKVTRRPSNPTANELRYKALYIESQKKLEDLTAANNELRNKLDVALGKLEVYEKGTHTFSELLGKAKDVMLMSNLSRVTEAALNLSSPHAGISSVDMATKDGATGAKRKKRANESN